MDVSSAPAEPPFIARLITAASQIDTAGKAAIACILVSWFFLDTLVLTLGTLQHGVRFYDMSAVIADPARMFFGYSGWAHRAGLGLLCLACLAAPILPHLRRRKALWLTYLAPLALMAICGAWLFTRTSGQFIAVPSDANQIAGSLIQFANDLIHRGGKLMTRHVSIGVGGYIGIIASLVLALRGVRQFRRGSIP